MIEELEYKMYGLITRNISDIQKAIQFSHAIQEYNNGISNNRMIYEESLTENFLINIESLRKSFIKWSTIDKTVILLEGGPTIWNIESKGMREHFNLLKENNIPFSYFEEPDLNNALTAICFLVDERVYNKKKYPDFDKDLAIDNIKDNWKYMFNSQLIGYIEEKYNEWVEFIGGESNVFLREFLKDKRLA